MSLFYDEPQHAPADYKTMEPCVEISDQQTGSWKFPEYAGSGIPIKEHPFIKAHTFHYWDVDAVCSACGSKNTLCIYLCYISGMGTGKDMRVEFVCNDCGKYTVDNYSD